MTDVSAGDGEGCCVALMTKKWRLAGETALVLPWRGQWTPFRTSAAPRLLPVNFAGRERCYLKRSSAPSAVWEGSGGRKLPPAPKPLGEVWQMKSVQAPEERGSLARLQARSCRPASSVRPARRGTYPARYCRFPVS